MVNMVKSAACRAVAFMAWGIVTLGIHHYKDCYEKSSDFARLLEL
jgi:hypothetical protein